MACGTPEVADRYRHAKSYRMAHDLQAINALVLKHPKLVPNPLTALSALKPEHQYFTVIDLASALFI